MRAMDPQERDRTLWKRWQQGDRAAGSELLAHYENALAALIRRLGVHEDADAEDVYGDLILELTKYKKSKDLQSSFFGLARRMTVSLVLRLRERGGRVKELEEPERVLARSEADTPFSFQEALEHCLDQLRKPQERELFQERFLEGWDNATLARRYQKSANHVAVLIYRAVRQMRQCLEGQGFAA